MKRLQTGKQSDTDIESQGRQVYAIEFTGRGGMIHYTYQFCRALAAQSVNVKLITDRDYELAGLPHNFPVERMLRLWNPRPILPSKWSQSFISQWLRRLVRAKNALIYYREWWRLIQYLRRERPKLVQLGEIRFPTDLIPLLLLRFSGLRLANICHNIAPFNMRRGSTALVNTSPLYRLVYRCIYRCFFAVFVHSETNRQDFLRMYGGAPAKIHSIPHGNEQLFLETAAPIQDGALRKKLDLPSSAPIALFFGALTKYKGVEYLLDAFGQVKQRLPTARLIIAGFPCWDIDIDSLQRRAEALKICDSVIFYLQYIPNEEVAAFFNLADVVVLPYQMIYQSGALQVAYTFGKPVVATRVGGLPEVVKHGETGLLVPPHDPSALAEALLTLLSDRDLCRRLGRKARELSETRHGWDHIACQVRQVYDDCKQN